MSAADRAVLAALFVKAAERMDNPAHKHGCCRAISDSLPIAKGFSLYSTPAHAAFKDAFPWIWRSDGIYHWWALDSDGYTIYKYPEDARQARVLALLFCAEMARLGEIG